MKKVLFATLTAITIFSAAISVPTEAQTFGGNRMRELVYHCVTPEGCPSFFSACIPYGQEFCKMKDCGMWGYPICNSGTGDGN